jgi:FMN phosphatase YigB (HAD superfamily)
MSLKDKIFIFDLHNTLYDEVMEYGGAMRAAIEYLVDVGSFNRSDLMQQIAAAHARLGSDWDERVWEEVEILKGLDSFHLHKARSIRAEISEALTKKYAYQDVIKDVHLLKEEGARVFIATEASANAAADAIRWLDLDGVIDGVYSWPCAHAYKKLEKTQQHIFPPHPSHPDVKLQKPHPFIIAAILLDCMKADGEIGANIKLEDVFYILQDKELDLSELESAIPKESIQGKLAIEAMKSKLCIEEERIKNYLSRTYYVGDSFFKDGYLARNAGVSFIHAAYGKIVKEHERFERAKEILYSVTGWEPFLLEFTQEAAKLPAISNKLKPQYVCIKNLRDMIEKVSNAGF